MEQILDIIISTDFFYSILRISTPIIYAALGALITSRAGVVNIGLEGMMLCAALTGVIISAFTQSALLGLAGAVLVSVAVSLMMSYVTLVLKSHITLTGIAINTFGSGATVFVLYLVCNDKGISSSLASKTIPQVNIPLLEHVPVLGEVLSGHNILTYLSLVAVALTWVLLNKTVLGLRIRAVGESERAAMSVGAKPVRYQFIAMTISGVLAGFGGAYMGTTMGTFGSALIFGMADSLANNLQALQMPPEFVQSIPYAVTILGLVVFSVLQRRKELKRMKQAVSKEG